MDPHQRARLEASRRGDGRFGTPCHSTAEEFTDPSGGVVDETAWPRTGGEQLAWEHDPNETMSRRARLQSRGPFTASIPPRIATQPLRLPAGLVAEAEDAHAELSRFDQEVGTLSAPLAPILLRSESAASSEVERLTASAKQVALARLGDSKSGNADLIVANSNAMESAIELADRLDTDSVIAMHRALLERSQPGIVGRFREVHVWVGGATPHTAQHVGPAPSRVPPLMDDLMMFARRTDLQVVPHIAVAHAQFETIHPFPDGNGRTGRALVHAMLRASGTTRQVTVPVSAGLLSDTDPYFSALTAYREGDPAPIVRVLTEASFRSLQNSKQLLSELDTARDRWDQALSARKGSSARRALDVLPEQPVITVKHLAARLGVSETSANTAIRQLEEAGVVCQSSPGRRNRHWQADAVLDALDAFAERARRGRA